MSSQLDGMLSHSFLVERKVKQGSVLSPAVSLGDESSSTAAAGIRPGSHCQQFLC